MDPRFFFAMTEVLNNKTESPNIQNFSSASLQDDNNNTGFDDSDRKQKIVYTSDFLKKFDKNKTKEFSQNIMQPQQPIGAPHLGGGELFNNNIDLENNQTHEYRGIIQRLKSIIVNSKDDNLMSMMRMVFSESNLGKSFLVDDYNQKRIPDIGGPIQNFVFLGDVEPSQMSPTPLNSFFSTHAANSSISGSLPPLRSPRKVESVPSIPVLPLSSQQQTQQQQQPIGHPSSSSTPSSLNSSGGSISTSSSTSSPATSTNTTPNTQAPFKSPRKLNTSGSGLTSIIPPGFSNESSPNTSSNIVSPSTTTTTPLSSTSPSTTTTTTTPTSFQPSGGKMKKSPSMPVIAGKLNGESLKSPNKPNLASNNNNNNNNYSNSNISFSNIKPNNGSLSSSANSISTGLPNLSGGKINTNVYSSLGNIGSGMNGSSTKDDSVSPTKKSTDHQPRKPMTKSVSMSSIGLNNQDPKCTSLEEITGQIYHLTKYQAGCRFLQKKLEEKPDSEHVTLIFNEVFDHLNELMIDPYGQYLIPQLMKYCDNNQRRQIVDKIAPSVETFACHVYGIHGIQKLLQYLSPDQVESIIASIKGKVIQLSKDNKGNYLIQSFLKQFSPEVNQFVCDAIMGNIEEICTHKVGCTVVNRCIDNANPEQLEKLVDKITEHSLKLVQDQFGNYVVQHLLSKNKAYSSKLIVSLKDNIAELSIQKFSSNVIEKCLQLADTPTYELIIKALTEADILSLLQDKYANFVIQTALDVSNDTQHAKLVKIIVPYIHQIKTPYVIHIQKKILQV
ncbi:hypothetical protein DDB_G0279557 [Dictyostelium discoideum AX4]|uniref:PUM-HD domain-containing protein n=1 Tax=Dictyostelium discoideum TaxID=44689 RepID=Q54WL9_DICDI|nr:hypothetical protein DDB_G0279557 [Dictyostelium discoideum AX4]EAL67717.1 hypothetical protein DDB_G0279557 [Dictyostelium discoideum AX4]|eukprot:XP_641698.1 hypothetical protein DDB_G0279557 [Dictyostelium discoideum AX4]